VDTRRAGTDDHALRQWEVRRSVGTHPRNVGWLVALRRSSPVRWPGMLLRALLSTEPVLREFYPQAPAGRRGLWLARWWRLTKAVHDLPRAVRIARRIG
jgi:hypothetical protein